MSGQRGFSRKGTTMLRFAMLALTVGLLLVPQSLWAQAANNNAANNNNNGGGLNTGAAGVIVDANGVLSMKVVADPRGMLNQQRLQQAKAALNADIAKP